MLKAIERQYLLPVGRRMTAPLRCDPSFVVIGAMKGGTTSLYRYLSESPQITMAHVKEVNYFALYPRSLDGLVPLALPAAHHEPV